MGTINYSWRREETRRFSLTKMPGKVKGFCARVYIVHCTLTMFNQVVLYSGVKMHVWEIMVIGKGQMRNNDP